MTWQLNRFVIPPVFAVYPTVQTNAILLYYNALTFVCYIPLLVALIVFYRFTGLAYTDVRGLKKSEVVMGNDGRLWIDTRRDKTKVAVYVPLLDIPRAILEKYADQTSHDRLLSIPANQKVNDYLKEIAAICGIDKNLTFHIAPSHVCDDDADAWRRPLYHLEVAWSCRREDDTGVRQNHQSEKG